MATYLSNQENAINKLSRVKCGALFMEAGTGKTRATIELIRAANADYVLWVTPFQTKLNLSREIKKWGGLECDVVGVESIQSSDRVYLELINKLTNSVSSFIVVDESLKIKNADAKRSKRMHELAKLSTYRLILNGTPLSRNLLDLWSQMHFLSPKILNMDQAEFKNTFCEYIRVTQRNGHQQYSKEFIKKYHNLPYLYKLIEPFIFESKLSISVGQQHIDLPYKLSEEEIAEHNAIKEKYLDNEALIFRNNNIFLEITQKMQHNYSLSPHKFAIIDALIERLDKSKVLIYAKYISTQERIKMHYKDIRIMSLQKHSFGLNLQEYNVIIFWDKTWDYAQREQIERRIFRTGQMNECIFYDLTGNVGLEKLINENIKRKRTLLDVFSELSNEELKLQL